MATRVPEAPHDVPAPIEVLTSEDLRNVGATTLRDALMLAAGVEVAPGGDAGPAGSVPEFWGLREFDAFLLVVDDVPWGGAFNPDLASLSMRDVERVEILRGPAPVTYGATSFVGVIHVVHKPAATSRSYATGHVGAYGTGGGGADIALPKAGEWSSRLSADVERQGFTDDRTSFARGHTLYRGNAGTSGNRTWVNADLLWLGQDPASPHPREGPALSPLVPVDANHNPAGAFLDETRVSAAFGLERPVGSTTTLSVLGSYTHSGHRQFRGFLRDVSETPGNATGFREDIDVNDVYGDAHLTFAEHAHVRFVAGGDLLFGNGEGRGATFIYTAPLNGVVAPSVTEPTTLDLGHRVAQLAEPLVGVLADQADRPGERVGARPGDPGVDEGVEHLPLGLAQPGHDRCGDVGEERGGAAEVGAPRDLALVAGLGLEGDLDPLLTGLGPEATDPSLGLGGREVPLGGQRADDHDLLAVHAHLDAVEPAVGQPPGEPVLGTRLATVSLGRSMSRVLWMKARGAPPSRADQRSATLIRPASGETTASLWSPYFSRT